MCYSYLSLLQKNEQIFSFKYLEGIINGDEMKAYRKSYNINSKREMREKRNRMNIKQIYLMELHVEKVFYRLCLQHHILLFLIIFFE